MPKDVYQTTAFTGYRDDVRNPFDKHGIASLLVPPSKNVRLSLSGEAYTRNGYEPIPVDFSSSGKPARGWYMAQYDLTFYAVGTKIYYCEGDITGSSTKYDTGVTITDGQARYTRGEEYAGQFLMTNKTDGCFMFAVMRLDGAVTAGATSIKCDMDGVIRANRLDTALSPSPKNLRINGVNETYTGTNTGAATFTGVTASASYTDNTIAIVVYNLASVFPKASKIVAWKESLHFVGMGEGETVFACDNATTSLAFTPFVTPTTIENMVTVSGGTSGTEMVGKFGKLVDAVATRDYLYLFKDNAVAFIEDSQVEADLRSVREAGSGTVQRTPKILSENYGILGADCAVDMGGVIPFITNNKRIIAIKTSLETGATIVFPDEAFDQDIRNTLEIMDDSQPNSGMFYHRGLRKLFAYVSINSEIVTLVYDNNIKKWLPPDTNKSFAGYFERKGTLFATELTEDTVYQMDVGNKDNSNPIDCYMSFGEMQFGGRTTEWKHIEVSGGIAQDVTVTFSGSVDGGTAAEKTIEGTDYSFTGAKAIGDFVIGDMVVGGSTSSDVMANWEKKFGIAPTTYGRRMQPTFYSDGAFSLKSYILNARPLSTSITTLE